LPAVGYLPAGGKKINSAVTRSDQQASQKLAAVGFFYFGTKARLAK